MDVLHDENTLKDIQPVSDDMDEQLEKLKRRELLPANVLIELCEKVFKLILCSFYRQKKL